MSRGVGVNEKEAHGSIWDSTLKMALPSLQVSMGKRKMAHFFEEGGYVAFERPLFSRPQSLS